MKDKRLIFFIVFSGFLLRLFFLYKGADVYYGHDLKFVNNDSGSFTNSFLNLLNNGNYSFNLNEPDAFYYRLPGYPFFWGLHYLVFGQWVYLAVSLTQIILDTIAIWLVYKIIIKEGTPKMAFTGAVLYAFYPFIIIWTTITGTELLATFLCILYVFYMTYYFHNRYFPFFAGLICVFMFMTREYLGIFFPFSILYFIWFQDTVGLKKRIITASYFSIVFICIYTIWPIRNYNHSGKLILLHGQSSGYKELKGDFSAFRSWMYSWNEGIEPYFESIIKTDKKVVFPDAAFGSEEDKFIIDSLIDNCRTCGSSFALWRHAELDRPNCDKVIESGFVKLKTSIIKNNPARYYIVAPMLNLKKAVFKNNYSTINSKPSLVQRLQSLLFGYRTILLLLGFAGLIIFRKNKSIQLIGLFSVFMFLFISFIIRQVEMRYLLQADTLLIIPASLLIGSLFEIKKRN